MRARREARVRRGLSMGRGSTHRGAKRFKSLEKPKGDLRGAGRQRSRLALNSEIGQIVISPAAIQGCRQFSRRPSGQSRATGGRRWLCTHPPHLWASNPRSNRFLPRVIAPICSTCWTWIFGIPPPVKPAGKISTIRSTPAACRGPDAPKACGTPTQKHCFSGISTRGKPRTFRPEAPSALLVQRSSVLS